MSNMLNRLSNSIKNISKWFWPPFLDTIIISFFTLQPSLYLAMVYWIKLEQYPMWKPLVSGDILLYSISYLSAAYLVYNQYRVRESDWKDNINKFVVIFIMAISALAVTMKLKDETANIIFARWTSFVCVAISVVIFFRAQVLARKPATDVAEVRREEQDVITENIG